MPPAPKAPSFGFRLSGFEFRVSVPVRFFLVFGFGSLSLSDEPGSFTSYVFGLKADEATAVLMVYNSEISARARAPNTGLHCFYSQVE